MLRPRRDFGSQHANAKIEQVQAADELDDPEHSAEAASRAPNPRSETTSTVEWPDASAETTGILARRPRAME